MGEKLGMTGINTARETDGANANSLTIVPMHECPYTAKYGTQSACRLILKVVIMLVVTGA